MSTTKLSGKAATISNSAQSIKSTVKSGNSGNYSTSNASSSTNSYTKSKSQDVTSKVKDRISHHRPKPGQTNSSSGMANRRPSKDLLRSERSSQEKSTRTTGTRTPLASARRNRDQVKPKSDLQSDKSSLENKVKDLITLSKTKDSEIKSLKEKLDSMTELLNEHQNDSTVSEKDELNSSIAGKLELSRLKAENDDLKDKLESILKVKRDDRFEKFKQSIDNLSNDDGIASPLEDYATASPQSTSLSASTENLLCTDGDFESESSAAVVCLTERINRMQENQISTNEELEATVQELTDLQKTITELTADKERLQEEKEYLMQKLCDTEKKLEQRDTESHHLRVLLADNLQEDNDKNALKQQYVQLLDERTHLLDVQDELNKQLRISGQENKESREISTALEEQNKHLERELSSAITEKHKMEKLIHIQENMDASTEKQNASILQLEEALAHEREKMQEIMSSHLSQAAGDSSNRQNEELLLIIDTIKNEKQELEEKYLASNDEFVQMKEENERLDEKVSELEELLEATNSKSKTDLSELSEMIDNLHAELNEKRRELEDAKETFFVMEDAVEQHIAVKKHDNHIISQLQNQISLLKEEKFRFGKEIQQLKRAQQSKNEEWKQFQSDLQMAVMIANDMKAETQAEVTRLRENAQLLEERVTKLQVENEQLRRRRHTASSIQLDMNLRPSQRSVEKDLAALRESMGVSRRKTFSEQHSPGVQSLIKSFDSQLSQPPTTLEGCSDLDSSSILTKPSNAPTSTAQNNTPVFSPSKSIQIGKKSLSSGLSDHPITVAVSPIQRHPITSDITTTLISSDSTTSINSSAKPSVENQALENSKPNTPDIKRSNGSDASLSSLILAKEKKNSISLDSRKPLSDLLMDRYSPSSSHTASVASTSGCASPISLTETPSTFSNINATMKHRPQPSSTAGQSSLTALARRYGGSKRNALLKWCQEKTKDYEGIDITNFSSSWNDGLAFCSLMHAFLPAHIPYESLFQQYISADIKSKNQLQAKNFRLAFAAAETVGIEPTLSVEEMTGKERPDWQRVMQYVTQIYNYFET